MMFAENNDDDPNGSSTHVGYAPINNDSDETEVMFVDRVKQDGVRCKDRWNGVFLIFVYIGIAGSLPWNFFINAEGYWQYKFRDVNQTVYDPSKRTSLQANFMGYLSIASMVASTTGFLICTFTSARCSIHSRIVVPLTIVVAVLGVTVGLVNVNSDSWQSIFCIISLISAAAMNGLAAFFQASAFGIAGLLQRKMVQAVMLGGALSGILASIAKILSIISDTEETTSALYYFCVAFGMMTLCIALYVLLLYTVYYRFHMIKVYALSVILVFLGTLAVFPAISSLVVSVNARSRSPWSGKFFSPFACFLLYNVGDFGGRCAASAVPIPPKWRIFVLILSIIRLVYIPLIMLCNAQPRNSLPVLFDTDLDFILIIATFAVSNGYLASVCMINVPKIVQPEHQESAGIFMALYMALGITAGAIISNPLLTLL